MKTYHLINTKKPKNTSTMKLFLFLWIAIIFNCFAQDFEQQYKIEDDLLDVEFVDVNTGWAVGENGKILKTTNGGITWNEQVSGTNRYLLGLDFVNSTLGWAVGQLGTILKTTDGGNTWVTQTSGVTTELRNIQFINSTTGWASGASGVILKTINGGTTWTLQTTETTYFIQNLFFLNASNGWAVTSSLSGIALILKTTNGGTTWTTQKISTTISYYDVYFNSATVGWIVGTNQTLLKTTDGGTTWNAQVVSSAVFPTFDEIQFTDANNGWISAGKYILKTTNGGANWSVVNSNILTSITGFYAIDAANLWAVGTGGNIISTSNGGSKWDYLIKGTTTSIYDIEMLNPLPSTDITGYAVGRNGVILKTTDAGLTWENQNSNTLNDLFSISFKDSSPEGWVVGASGTILKTTDGGVSWVPQISGVNLGLTEIQYVNSETLFTVGNAGTILKTTNGGSTWTSLISGVTGSLIYIYFKDINTGWVVGINGTILKTIDGGTTWNAQVSTTTYTLFSICFKPSSDIGFAVGSGVILKTINGGSTWQNITPSSPTTYSDVKIIDGVLTVIGDNGTILTSDNEGSSFSPSLSLGSEGQGLNAIDFTHQNVNNYNPGFFNTWFVGRKGIFKKTCTPVNNSALGVLFNSVDISSIGDNTFSNSAVTLEATFFHFNYSKHIVFWRGNTSNTSGIAWGTDYISDKMNLWISGNNGSGWVNYYPIILADPSKPVHIALVLLPSAGTISIYKDGVFQSTINAIFTLNGAGFKTIIGGSLTSSLPTNVFNIDEMRIWNIARTNSDINTNKNKHLLGNETGLLAYYSFNSRPNVGAVNIKNDVINSTIGHTSGRVVYSSNNLPFKTITQFNINECQPLQLLSSPAENYLWKGPNGFTSTERNPQISKIQLLGAGEYRLRVGTLGCSAPVQTIQVGVNHNYLDIIKKSGNETGTNTYTAAKKLIAPPNYGQLNTISNSAKTTYKAGYSIDFLPGFQAQNGAVFKAEIKGCN